MAERETAGSENKARQWIRSNIDTIVILINESIDRTKEHIKYVDRVWGADATIGSIFPYLVLNDNDPFSNSVCEMLVANFPEDQLEDVKKVFSEVNKSGVTVGHAYFLKGKFVIDPTFGQFVSLDTAIEQHPELFEGRVLVASKAEIAEKFNIVY